MRKWEGKIYFAAGRIVSARWMVNPYARHPVMHQLRMDSLESQYRSTLASARAMSPVSGTLARSI